jgi:predicted phage terminase large subunit-like protein
VSDTSEQAEGILKSIRYELEDNDKLKEAYGSLKGDVWNDSRLETTNDICIEALGTGKKVRGRKYKQYRPTLIIVDDPQNDEDIESPSSRSKQWSWFLKALLPAGDVDTNVVLIGTMMHKECIVGYAEKLPRFKTIRFKSLLKFPDNMTLWSTWESLYLNAPSSIVGGVLVRDPEAADKFYSENKEEMDKGAVVLWKEKEDLLTLMKMRAEDRNAFNSEKQNEPFDPSKCEFPPDWVDDNREEIWYDKLPPKESINFIIGALDLAKGKETKKHDYTARINLYNCEEDNRAYVDETLKKVPVNIAIEELVEEHNSIGYNWFGVETNAFQELVADELEKRVIDDHLDLTVVPVVHTTNKSMRVARLGNWLKQGFFKFRRNCPYTNILMDQIRAFPNPKEHDDGPDALETALSLLCEAIAGAANDQTIANEQFSDFDLD